jgi:hypothetical protein
LLWIALQFEIQIHAASTTRTAVDSRCLLASEQQPACYTLLTVYLLNSQGCLGFASTHKLSFFEIDCHEEVTPYFPSPPPLSITTSVYPGFNAASTASLDQPS